MNQSQPMPAGWPSGGSAPATAVIAAPGPISVEVRTVSAPEPAANWPAGAASAKAATAAEIKAMRRTVPGMAVPPILIDSDLANDFLQQPQGLALFVGLTIHIVPQWRGRGNRFPMDQIGLTALGQGQMQLASAKPARPCGLAPVRQVGKDRKQLLLMTRESHGSCCRN